MRSFLRQLFNGLFPLFVGLASQLAVAAPMVIGYADYRPYSYPDGGVVKGLEVDVLNAVLAERLGVELEHRVLPWKRVQHYVASGELDAFVAVASKQRSAFAEASKQPVITGRISAFVRADNSRFLPFESLSLDRLKPHRLAVIAGSGWAAKHLPGYMLEEAFSIESMGQMLQAGRVAAVVENSLIFADHLRSNGMSADIRAIAITQTEFDLVLYVSHKSPYLELLDSFDRELEAMHLDGSHAALVRPYEL